MAGQNITAHLDARFAELNAKMDSQKVELNGKIDAQKEAFGTEIRATRWMMGAILALLATLAALGLFNTARGLMR